MLKFYFLRSPQTMSTKLTPSQIKKIIKEEIKQVLNERSLGRSLKVDISDVDKLSRFFWMDGEAEKKTKQEFDSLLSALSPVIQKYKKLAGEDAIGFQRLEDEILKKQSTWQQVIAKFRYRLKYAETGDDMIRAGIQAFFDIAGEMDNQFDELDPYDGFASAGFGRAKSGMDADQSFARKYMSTNKLEFPDALVSTFINWLFGVTSGQKTPIVKKKDCEKAKEVMAMIDNMKPEKVPEYIAKIIKKPTTPLGPPRFTGQIKAVAGSPVNEQQGAGFLASLFSGLGLAMPTMGDVKQKAKAAVAAYYNCDEVSPIEVPKKKGKGDPCIKFTKLAMQVTGTNDPKLAVKTVQELLVNRGYSVIKGQTDSPFAGGGKGVAQEKDFKKFGIDGRCGPGTMGAVERFQEDNTLNPDGLVGPKTWAVLTKGLSALSSKQKQSAPVSGLLGPDAQTAIRIYTYLFDQLDGDTVRAAQQVLPRLVKRGSDFSIGGKTVSDQAALVDILNQNVEKLLAMTEDELNSKLKPREGVSLEPKLRLAQAKEMISKTPLQENKSYNMSFDKWSKLWE